MLAQDAMDHGARDRHLVKALQIVGDPAGPEVIMLAKIQNLVDDVGFRGVGRVLWRSWLIAQPGDPESVKSAFPLVARDAQSQTNTNQYYFGVSCQLAMSGASTTVAPWSQCFPPNVP